MKKLLFAISLSMAFSANATEFLGINLESSTPNQLHAVLQKSGANLLEKESTSLMQLYQMKNSDIPNAVNLVTYWNEKKEFVGLRIGFSGYSHEQNALLKNLVSKFGEAKNISIDSLNNKKLPNDYRAKENYTWIEDQLIINMNTEHFKTLVTPGYNRAFDSFTEKYFLRFIHPKRLEGLKKYLNTQVNAADSNTWKGKL